MMGIDRGADDHTRYTVHIGGRCVLLGGMRRSDGHHFTVNGADMSKHPMSPEEQEALRDMVDATRKALTGQPPILTAQQVRWRELFELALRGTCRDHFVLNTAIPIEESVRRHGVGTVRLAAAIADAALQLETDRGLL